MTSSIHYKFRTQNIYKTLPFDGPSIGVAELKRSICIAESIRAELFDLQFSNSFSNKPYVGDDVIPRNSSVTVQRVPLENAGKVPKISAPEIVALDPNLNPTPESAAHISSEEFEKMTEDERLKHAMHQSTYKYAPGNYKRRPMNPNQPVQQAPPDYICNRCNQLGHYPKACPLINIRRTTGIPNEELMETTADDPQAMLHPSGRFVIPIMHYRAREQRKQMEEQKRLGLANPIEKKKEEKKILPPELRCRICNELFKEALVANCCGVSFCADCIQQHMLDVIANDTPCVCPVCKAPLSADTLFPNNSLREAVNKYKRSLLDPAVMYTNADVTCASTPKEATNGSPASRSPAILDPKPLSPVEQPEDTNETPKQTSSPPLGSPAPAATAAPIVAEPLRMPTVNLSVMLASKSTPATASTVNSDFNQPPPLMSQPVSKQSGFVDPNLSTELKNSSDHARSPMLEFDERDKEAMDIAWDKLATGDDTLDMATLLNERRIVRSPSPIKKVEKKETRDSKESRSRRRSRSHSPRSRRDRDRRDRGRDRNRRRSPSRSPRRRHEERRDKEKERDRESSKRRDDKVREKEKDRTKMKSVEKEKERVKEKPVEKEKMKPVEKEKIKPVEKEKVKPVEKEKVKPVEKEKVKPVEKEKVKLVQMEKAKPVEKDKVRPDEKEKAKLAEKEKAKPDEKEKKKSIDKEKRKTDVKDKFVPDEKEKKKQLEKERETDKLTEKKGNGGRERDRERSRSKKEKKREKKKKRRADEDDSDAEEKHKKRRHKEKKRKRDRKRHHDDDASDDDRRKRPRL